MSNKNKSTRPKFSLEFKQDAARLVIEKGYTQQEAADHLGVSLSAMRRWVKAERPNFTPVRGPAAAILSFAWPKESIQRKGHPMPR